MLYEFVKDVRVLLAAKGYPVTVIFGPERVTRGLAPSGHVIVIEHDEAGDTLAAALGLQRNAQKLRTRMIGSKATIYARSSLPSAHRGDHERECEKIVDAFTAAAYKWGATGRVGDLPFGKMGYVKDAPEDAREAWPGVRYEIFFKVPRGVYDRTYVGEQNAGAARPTGQAMALASRTEATAPGYDPATGCDST